MRPRNELLTAGRATLTREEKRFADSGTTPDRLLEIQDLLNTASDAEKATIGYKALSDLWNAFQSERDDLARADEATKTPPTPPNRFF